MRKSVISMLIRLNCLVTSLDINLFVHLMRIINL